MIEMIDVIVNGACGLAAGISLYNWYRCYDQLKDQRTLTQSECEAASRMRVELSTAKEKNKALSSQLEESADKLSVAYADLRGVQKQLEEESTRRVQCFERSNIRYQAELKACAERDAAHKELNDYRISMERFEKINCELNEEVQALTAERDELRAQLEHHRELVTSPLYAENSKDFLEGLEAVLAYNIGTAQKAGGAE